MNMNKTTTFQFPSPPKTVSISTQNTFLPLHHLNQPPNQNQNQNQDLESLHHFDHTPPPISSSQVNLETNLETNMPNQHILQQLGCGFRVIEENLDANWNELQVGFVEDQELDLGFGFVAEDYGNDIICEDGDEDVYFGEDMFVRTTGRSGMPEIYVGGMRVSNTGYESDEDVENEIVEAVGEVEVEEEEEGCWDAFQVDDANAYVDDDFGWEEVGERVDEREVSSMFFGAEADDDASVTSPVLLSVFEEPSEEQRQGVDASEWQVLSNVSFEPAPDSEDQHEEYDYAEYEMFFGQFADIDVSSSGRPPASRTAVVNLATVVMTQDDVVKNNVICAVCKDDMVVGEMATQLPCSHRYHGDCILPWLAVRNTCPVCRHELPTDDLDYERRKAERVARA